jgi:hypothetical protein
MMVTRKGEIMNYLDFFNDHVKSKLSNQYSLTWSDFLDGDFGDLKRLEFESSIKIGTIDFWSLGWIGMDIVDMHRKEQVLNVLYSPDQEGDIKAAFGQLLKLLS